jgi:NTP pyrophosphatase (non-canonical NTP hydrolase)
MEIKAVNKEKRAHEMTFKDLSERMDQFVTTQSWYDSSSSRQQTERNLAISVVLEAAELLECYQWQDKGNPEAVGSELADIILYLVQLARVAGIDLSRAVSEKIDQNRQRRWPEIQLESERQ